MTDKRKKREIPPIGQNFKVFSLDLSLGAIKCHNLYAFLFEVTFLAFNGVMGWLHLREAAHRHKGRLPVDVAIKPSRNS